MVFLLDVVLLYVCASTADDSSFTMRPLKKTEGTELVVPKLYLRIRHIMIFPAIISEDRCWRRLFSD